MSGHAGCYQGECGCGFDVLTNRLIWPCAECTGHPKPRWDQFTPELQEQLWKAMLPFIETYTKGLKSVR